MSLSTTLGVSTFTTISPTIVIEDDAAGNGRVTLVADASGNVSGGGWTIDAPSVQAYVDAVYFAETETESYDADELSLPDGNVVGFVRDAGGAIVSYTMNGSAWTRARGVGIADAFVASGLANQPA